MDVGAGDEGDFSVRIHDDHAVLGVVHLHYSQRLAVRGGVCIAVVGQKGRSSGFKQGVFIRGSAFAQHDGRVVGGGHGHRHGGRAGGAKAIYHHVIKAGLTMKIGVGHKLNLPVGSKPHRAMHGVGEAGDRQAIAIGGDIVVCVIGEQGDRVQQQSLVFDRLRLVCVGDGRVVDRVDACHHLGHAGGAAEVHRLVAKAHGAVVVGVGAQADGVVRVEHHGAMLGVKHAGDTQHVAIGGNVIVLVVGQQLRCADLQRGVFLQRQQVAQGQRRVVDGCHVHDSNSGNCAAVAVVYRVLKAGRAVEVGVGCEGHLPAAVLQGNQAHASVAGVAYCADGQGLAVGGGVYIAVVGQ